MKKVLFTIVAIATLVLSQSCQKEKPVEGLKAPVLTADAATVEIDPTCTDKAVTLTWTESGENVSYKLQIAAGNDKDFAKAEYVQYPALEKEFDQKMISLYAENFGLEGNYSFIFRVTAMRDGMDDAVSNVVEVKFTTKQAPALVSPLLSADKVEVIANPNSKDEAVSVSWTSAATAGLAPSYKFEFSTAQDFTDAEELPVADDYLYVSLTGAEIAEYAAQNDLGEEFTVYARIVASADGAADVTSNEISVKVKIDYQIPENLYVYFWADNNVTNAHQMEYLGDGVFTWTGDCVQWEFKFITANAADNDYWTGFFRDENAEDYWTMKDGTKDQCMFMLNDKGMAPGKYAIKVNCKTLKVEVEAVAEPLPEHLYLDFWAWGDGTAAKEMTSLGNGKFTWTGYIPKWQFKFTTSNATGDDYWTGYFRDPDAENYWTLKKSSTEVMFQLNDKQLVEGDWTINVDLNTLAVEMVPHIYPVGAFPWGWEKANAQEMTYEGDGWLSYKGSIGEGAFKFLSEVTSEDWPSYVRKDGAENYWTAVRSCDQENPWDLQFNIADKGLAAGNYLLRFNPFTMELKIEVSE